MKLDRIQNPIARNLVEWLLILLVAVFLFLILRFFVFRIANVDGDSMEPTLKDRDLVVLSRLTYFFTDPKPGEIVAFPYKENPSDYYIKRIVGSPGDVIDLVDRRFMINGEPLEDDFSEEAIISLGDARFPITVPEGQYFVLGDNRNGSKDSRFSSVGCIPKEKMVGKVIFRLWPFKR
ncbi:MAG: signal peptidase I [Clostridiales bacterium]|nr:signal peptidase I [Clostridiales bacterium]